MSIEYYEYAVATEEVDSEFCYDYVDGGTYAIDSRTSIDDGSPSTKTANYTSYELFCFMTKFNELLKTINDNWSSRLIPKRNPQNKCKVSLFVEIFDGGTFIPITTSLKPQIERFVSESKLNAQHLLLFKPPRNGMRYNETTLSYWWMVSVLPYVSLPDTLEYKRDITGKILKENTYPFYSEGGLYIALNNDINYNSVYLKILFGLYDDLCALYRRGCIRLHKTDDAKFIKKWRLIQYNPNDNSEDYTIFVPTWRNFIIAKDCSDFLQRVYMGRNIVINEVSDRPIYVDKPKSMKQLVKVYRESIQRV